jgi:hypothetical protein
MQTEVVVVRYDNGGGEVMVITGTVISRTPIIIVVGNPCCQNGGSLHEAMGKQIEVPIHRCYSILTPSVNLSA